jgi:hypothetical protein
MRFIQSEEGQRFRQKCRILNLQVEYELHAMHELLPRELFDKEPSLFRMNEAGERTADSNLCVSSERALEIITKRAISISRELRPTTGRYFLWGDDGEPYCRCPGCADLSESDQALILENRLLEALRADDPRAQVAHLAYARTLRPPRRIKPKQGIFLEYAPIDRRYDLPLAANGDQRQRQHLESLDANLAVFGSEGAQALEYWLDSSRFSRWKRPAVKVPLNVSVLIADIETYASRGIRHIATFAVWIDEGYVTRYGDPPLGQYGSTFY